MINHWWMNGSWRERFPVARFIKDMNSADNNPSTDHLIRYFNPTCTHERCAYDIMNCDACAAFTKLKIESRQATDADLK